MRRSVVFACGLVWLAAAPAAAQVTQVQLDYDTYAAGVKVMQMRAFFGLGH